jgi:glycerophosphoryl diester phosphodiesterase
MKIIEQQMIAKTGNPETCEDRYCVTKHYACVIDGATDVTGKRFDGLTSGQLISRLIAETVTTLPPEADLEEIMGIINADIVRYYKKQAIYEEIFREPSARPTAAMVLYSRKHHLIWMIGDCQCMVNGVLHTNQKAIDEITANARSMFLEAELQKGTTIAELQTNDTGFEAIRPFIRMQYHLQNSQEDTQYSYAAITGFDLPLWRIKVVRPPRDARFIVLASDGYPDLRLTLEQSETRLHHILTKDPLCFREYKSVKGLNLGNVSFDDRTYLKIEL